MQNGPDNPDRQAYDTTVKIFPDCKTKTALFSLTLLLACGGHAASKDQEQLNKEIKQLSTQLDKQKEESSNLNDDVTQMEKKLGEITRKEHDTEKKIAATLARLQEANIRKSKLDEDLKLQRSALAQQLQAMYTAGEQSHLRLLLRQDNPSDISRTLRYFEYLNTHRTQNIQATHDTLGKIKAITNAIEQDRQDLRGLEETLNTQKRDIQTTLGSRESALQRLDSDIRSKQSRLDRLRKDEADLQAMVDRIAAKAEADRKEKQRRQTTARKAEEQKKAEQKAAQQATQQTTQHAAKEQTPARTPSKTETVATTTATPAPSPTPAPRTVATQRRSFVSNKPFSVLMGKLPAPVNNGRVIHAYGTSRNEKQSWRGIVIAAPGGSKVQAVAPGRVLFAGWMDGYGHLIIIEHDQNYMSLYGYNRAVYKKEGQIVKAGEAIAAVGNSSGQRENALYFEIRRKTVPQNPAQWLH